MIMSYPDCPLFFFHRIRFKSRRNPVNAGDFSCDLSQPGEAGKFSTGEIAIFPGHMCEKILSGN